MRIAMVVPTFPQLSETFIVTKALGLVDRGIDVHVVCGSTKSNWALSDHRVQSCVRSARRQKSSTRRR